MRDAGKIAETRKKFVEKRAVLVADSSDGGFFMMRRAIFGLQYWHELPEEGRRLVIRDLVGSVGPANPEPGGRYRKILAAKSEADREGVRTAIVASGLATKAVIQALGL